MVDYLRRERPKGKTGALGGESQFCENSEVVGNF